ncbi:TP53-regulated inhibitor of apoptosis 1-B like protein [Argiope bruennichi]|uniref:TP53-regulated inhibitor of apoptosis 1-B like protein n=1 Tax=Argiope bruennichi TaxID=94029 RepID=A0A8T0FXD9_ARGBR|nr:TP53-regulated inhibitor of apoptosis 1-B like protein [Argiope bruennichi]
MESIGKDCRELKQKYEACFNAWYSEKFLKNEGGDISVCEPLFQEYQKCLKVALKKNNVPLWELNGGILKDAENKSSCGPT